MPSLAYFFEAVTYCPPESRQTHGIALALESAESTGGDRPTSMMNTLLSRAPVAMATLVLSLIPSLGLPASAGAQTLAPQERMCDPTFEDCREDLLTYIRQET